MIIRVIFDIVLLFALFVTPFWCVLFLALTGIIFFERYGEAVFLLFLIDLLFYAPHPFVTATIPLMLPLSLYGACALLLRTWIGTYVRKHSV